MPPRQEPPHRPNPELHQMLCQMSIADDLVAAEPQYADVLNFGQKVKTILNCRDSYMEFLRILHTYNEGMINTMELCTLLADFFKDLPDLYLEFVNLFPPTFLPPEYRNLLEKNQVASAPEANADRAN